MKQLGLNDAAGFKALEFPVLQAHDDESSQESNYTSIFLELETFGVCVDAVLFEKSSPAFREGVTSSTKGVVDGEN